VEDQAACWNCAAAIDADRVTVEAILHTRSESEGGPFQSVRCRGCNTENGVLIAPRMGCLFYPLVGQQDPTLADWIVPHVSLELLHRARTWWRRNRGRVEQFRHAAQEQAKGGARRARTRARRTAKRTESRETPPPRKRARRSTPPPEPPPPPPEPEPAPRPEPEPRAEPARQDEDPLPPHPREVLGVAEDATREEVQRAFRERLKRCHPDLVANLDEEFQQLAHRKAKQLRAAYEFLLAEYDAAGAG
jgi:DnaJ-domain-containing protein 1